MGWWQERKAKKKLMKLGMKKDQVEEIVRELTEGYKGVLSAQELIKEQESEDYRSIMTTLKFIGQSNTSREHKRFIATKLVEKSGLSNEKKHDLLQGIERTYGT